VAAEHAVLFEADVIDEAVQSLAAAVDRDFGGDGLIVLTVLKGAVIFSADLVRAMDTETELAFIGASSYSAGFVPDESLILHDLDVDVSDRDVLIVDDIIDTGRTLKELAALVETSGARTVSTMALVSKTSRRLPESEPDYFALEVGDELIYGYGLDWDERYRDLPFIAQANP